MSVSNGQYSCTCYHSLFVLNKFGDLERFALHPRIDHSADGWHDSFNPAVERYRGKVSRLHSCADPTIAMSWVYESMIAERINFAIRNPTNKILKGRINHLFTMPVGRPQLKCGVFLQASAIWLQVRRSGAR